MNGIAPYVLFPGTAREALTYYADVFAASTELHTFAEFGRSDGPPDAIAHGLLVDAPISLYAADIGDGEPAFNAQGLLFSLLGTADSTTSREWFARLSAEGTIVDQLQQRPWGAYDGQVLDRFGLQWLIGFETDATP
jgi:PhnB protein